MRIARTIGLALGLTLLSGVWAVTFSRAQQPGEKSAPPAPTKAALRDRVITLRTEVDLLQVEYDGARATLVEWIRDSGKADLMGIDVSALWSIMKMEFGGISGDIASLMQTAPVVGKLDEIPPEAGLRAIQDAAKKGKDDLRVAFDRKKQEFAKTARLLNEKKLDLAEAEKQYQREN
jgi:hypothetical protein